MDDDIQAHSSHSHEPDTWFYYIDDSDLIVNVSATWESFAAANEGLPECSFSALQGKPILSQFSDAETRMIYSKIFKKVRSAQRVISFLIHCDALDTIRHLEASIIPLPHQFLKVQFKLVNEIKRDPAIVQKLCNTDDNIITMCSYCGDLKNSKGQWQPIEQEITARDFFQHPALPKISHGICPDCSNNFLNSINLA
ncbi:hypothetical protein [Mariprofundus micogutta]|uniref:hypothetical protein n=1 Tax=Mariprofundus micogutta TaxID=1921010 RepID=UPI0009346E37|nr:hypothetical protein [Mariprofundus micogutta]